MLQFVLEVIEDQVEEVVAVICAADAVRLVGIDHETELLARLDQRFDHLNGVLEMHVVVSSAVGQEKRAVQLVGNLGQIEVGITG